MVGVLRPYPNLKVRSFVLFHMATCSTSAVCCRHLPPPHQSAARSLASKLQEWHDKAIRRPEIEKHIQSRPEAEW